MIVFPPLSVVWRTSPSATCRRLVEVDANQKRDARLPHNRRGPRTQSRPTTSAEAQTAESESFGVRTMKSMKMHQSRSHKLVHAAVGYSWSGVPIVIQCNSTLRSMATDRSARLQLLLLLPPSKPESTPGGFDLDELRALVSKGIPDAADNDNGKRTPDNSTASDLALRPLAWRVLLGVVKGYPHEWPEQLHTRRADYQRWKRDLVGGTSARRGSGAVRTEAEHRHDISLMKEIEKDVFRTRSDLAFFSSGSITHQQMLYILFVFATLHPSIGYVQGMNEILAPIIYVCSKGSGTSSASVVEADTYHFFASVMSSLKVLYSQSSDNPLSGADLQMGRLGKLLRQHDAALWQHLNSVGLTPDLYSFRWYMTLLAREFSMPNTLLVWDALLADPKRFSFLHYVNCAIVRSQRSFLMVHGFTDGLKRLQNLQSSDNSLDIPQLVVAAEEMRQLDRNLDTAHQVAAGTYVRT